MTSCSGTSKAKRSATRIRCRANVDGTLQELQFRCRNIESRLTWGGFHHAHGLRRVTNQYVFLLAAFATVVREPTRDAADEGAEVPERRLLQGLNQRHFATVELTGSGD